MLNIVLVDDEHIIREGIRQMIDWEANGYQLRAVLENGAQALEYLQSHAVDIVITDIRMPVMDGLQLIEASAALPQPPRFVLLSGYGDFQYASTAMRYGVRHYLLKPSDEDEILAALGEISESLQKEQAVPEASDELEKGDVVSRMKVYTLQNIANPSLSLKWLARHCLFMDEGYLSKIFYRKTKLKFSKYLTTVRMDLAKKLLREDPEIKMAELCEKFGYENNPTYFSTVFKNYTGFTLTDYRKSKR